MEDKIKDAVLEHLVELECKDASGIYTPELTFKVSQMTRMRPSPFEVMRALVQLERDGLAVLGAKGWRASAVAMVLSTSNQEDECFTSLVLMS